jgi:TPP-dependent pyruvate/acetoin dehydrogenase alpha subunit
MEARAKEQIDEAVSFASQAPMPDGAEAAYPVYAEDVQHA